MNWIPTNSKNKNIIANGDIILDLYENSLNEA